MLYHREFYDSVEREFEGFDMGYFGNKYLYVFPEMDDGKHTADSLKYSYVSNVSAVGCCIVMASDNFCEVEGWRTQ